MIHCHVSMRSSGGLAKIITGIYTDMVPILSIEKRMTTGLLYEQLPTRLLPRL